MPPPPILPDYYRHSAKLHLSRYTCPILYFVYLVAQTMVTKTVARCEAFARKRRRVEEQQKQDKKRTSVALRLMAASDARARELKRRKQEKAPNTIRVLVPFGARPGQTLQVPIPNGQSLRFLVPPGATPGVTQLQISYKPHVFNPGGGWSVPKDQVPPPDKQRVPLPEQQWVPSLPEQQRAPLPVQRLWDKQRDRRAVEHDRFASGVCKLKCKVCAVVKAAEARATGQKEAQGEKEQEHDQEHEVRQKKLGHTRPSTYT